MRNTFLSELADRLHSRYADDLTQIAVIFPSLRARTFFNDTYSKVVGDKPFWQPVWYSVDDIMERVAGIVKGERIVLLSELYKVYVKYHPNESFDKFYFWGDMLISDFDMIDKYLIDAHQLLRNIEEIKELETDVSYLTPEQLRIISFWKSIGSNDSLSEQKLRFLEVWKSLPKVYDDFRARLFEAGYCYTGMMYRLAAERIKSGEHIEIPNKHYIIAGFNALSNCEKILFDYLQNSEYGADFYWDYDSYYVGNEKHEAGMFLRDNIARYGSAEEITHDNFTQIDKQIYEVSCSSNVVQCKYLNKILSDIPAEERDKSTAIVLTDENLLVPLIHSLPRDIDKINVTMGYPLHATLAYSFIERLCSLQAHAKVKTSGAVFYHNDVVGLLLHPYILDCEPDISSKLHKEIVNNHIISVEQAMLQECKLFNIIFNTTSDWSSLSQYLINVLAYIAEHIQLEDKLHIEYLRVAVDTLGKVARSLRKCDITPSVEVYTSLLRRHLQTITIPFEGEPLEGIQVMGILETRNIDFKNVIILSMTDTNFPGDRTGQSSFIPYNLRAAYGMPTPEEHEAMYAYYFYRLIQRAENVNMLYCSSSDKMSTGECSRYIYQLEYESKYRVKKIGVGVDLNLDNKSKIVVEKDEKVRAELEKYLADGESRRELSATSLFQYIECPLKFYFSKVAHLKPSTELEDEIDALMIGNILHESMEMLYTPYKNVDKPWECIGNGITQQQIEDAVDKTMSKMLFCSDHNRREDFNGSMELVREIIIKYIKQGIIPYDVDMQDYIIRGIEEVMRYRHPISGGRYVNFMGKADRVDELSDGSLRIIDYKSSGSSHQKFNGIHNLFRGSGKSDRVSNVFQTLLYSMILSKNERKDTVPTLYFASQMIKLKSEYSPLLLNDNKEIEHYSDVADGYEKELGGILEELFNYDISFCQAEKEETCKYCDFIEICRRKKEQEY